MLRTMRRRYVVAKTREFQRGWGVGTGVRGLPGAGGGGVKGEFDRKSKFEIFQKYSAAENLNIFLTQYLSNPINREAE